MIEEAIAAAFGAAPDAVRHARRLNGDLTEVVLLARHGRLEQAAATADSRPDATGDGTNLLE